MTDLEFEHALRARVNAALEMCEQFDASMNEHNVRWDIKYNAEDGGDWVVVIPYRYRASGTMRAAALGDALDLAFDLIRKTERARTLPAAITYVESND